MHQVPSFDWKANFGLDQTANWFQIKKLCLHLISSFSNEYKVPKSMEDSSNPEKTKVSNPLKFL